MHPAPGGFCGIYISPAAPTLAVARGAGGQTLAAHWDILALSVSYGRSEGNRPWNDGVAEMGSSKIGRGFQKMVDWM
jgi:hypothetical protein